MNLRLLKVKDIFSWTKWKIVMASIYLRKLRPWLKKKEASFLLSAGETTLDGKDLQLIKTGLVNPDKIDEVTKAMNITMRYLACKTPCMETGFCVHCGCTTPDNILIEKNYCSGKKWGIMSRDKEFLLLRIKQLLNQ